MMVGSRTRCVRWLAGVTACVLLGWFAPGSAQAQVNSGKVSFNTGIDLSHAYFFRGIRQENKGFVAQPYADVNFNLYSNEDASGLTNITYSLGTWNSLHTGPSGGDGPAPNTAAWYESDFFTGVALTIDNWEAGITYTSYLSPNDAFSTTQELALSLGMDDSALLGSFSMFPHVILAIETSNSRPNNGTNGGADGGASEGVYLELGVEPILPIVDPEIAEVSFPITIGLSLSNYYENGLRLGDPDRLNDGFGFFSVGATIAFPLPVSENYGAWSLMGSLQFMTLGNYLEVLNNGDGGQVIGAFGFNIGY